MRGSRDAVSTPPTRLFFLITPYGAMRKNTPLPPQRGRHAPATPPAQTPFLRSSFYVKAFDVVFRVRENDAFSQYFNVVERASS